MRPTLSVMAAAAMLLAGCGGTGGESRTAIPGDTLSVYSGLPLRGPRAPLGRAVLRGEQLALHDAGGHVGNRTISLVALDDADPKTGTWAPGIVAANARRAVENPTTIAYLGEVDSGATAVSVPITNAGQVLQVSPLSGYTGLTQTADKGEPDKYYPSGRRTFARLVPPDEVEAAALADWVRSLGIGRVGLAYDGLQEGLGQGGELERALTDAKIKVDDVVRVDPHDGPSDVDGDARELVGAGVPAVIYAGGSPSAARALLTAVRAQRPATALFATSGVADADLTRALSPGDPPLRVTSPLLPLHSWPAPARRMASRYRSLYHAAPPPAALFGFEAMRGVLAAIGRAGPAGNDRRSVLDAYFRTTAAASVLGPYAIDSRGDTTLGRYGGFADRDGRLELERLLGTQD